MKISHAAASSKGHITAKSGS